MATRQTAIRLSKEKQDKLSAIAYSLDCTYGGKGSIGKLLDAIANNDLIISKNFSKNT
jgi:hypothetical protein